MATRSAQWWATDEFERRYVKVRDDARVLITGSHIYAGKEDRRKRYANVVGVDAIAGDGVDVCLDLEGDVSALGKFDHIECISVLEHSRRPWAMAKNLVKLLRTDGTLHISVPFVWRYHGYPHDYWRFTMQGVEELFAPDIRWSKIAYASNGLRSDAFLRGIQDSEDYPHLPRCEVVGFGTRRS
jgi:SAM-dependent methyltransferase